MCFNSVFIICAYIFTLFIGLIGFNYIYHNKIMSVENKNKYITNLISVFIIIMFVILISFLITITLLKYSNNKEIIEEGSLSKSEVVDIIYYNKLPDPYNKMHDKGELDTKIIIDENNTEDTFTIERRHLWFLHSDVYIINIGTKDE